MDIKFLVFLSTEPRVSLTGVLLSLYLCLYLKLFNQGKFSVLTEVVARQFEALICLWHVLSINVLTMIIH